MSRLRQVVTDHPVALLLSVGAAVSVVASIGILLGRPGWDTATTIRLLALTVVLCGFAAAFWIGPLLETRR